MSIDFKDVPAMTHKELRPQCAWGADSSLRGPPEVGGQATAHLQRSASTLPYLLEDILRLAICLSTQGVDSGWFVGCVGGKPVVKANLDFCENQLGM